MQITKLTFILVGGLVAVGAAAAYKLMSGNRFRKRATAPKNSVEPENSKASAEAMELMLEDEDDEEV